MEGQLDFKSVGHLERVSVELLLQRDTVRTVDVRRQGGPEFGSRAAQGSAEGVREQAGSILWLPGSQGGCRRSLLCC